MILLQCNSKITQPWNVGHINGIPKQKCLFSLSTDKILLIYLAKKKTESYSLSSTGNNRPEVAAVDEDHIAEGGGAHSEHRLHGGVQDV